MSASDRDHPLGALQAFLQARRRDTPHVTALVVAHSGGPDSLALLLAAAQLAPAMGFRLRAAHVHHGLHPDADRWADRACAQASALALPCDVLHVTVASTASLEGAARRARYDALAEALAPEEALLLGHHQDDQAETLLQRLMRGAGTHGLAGMRAVTHWQRLGGVMLRWRPWLGLPRAALAHWLPRAMACQTSHGTILPEPVQDPANQDPRFDRTLLRHQVLPLLRMRWPQATAQLARSAAQLAGQTAALDHLADDWLARQLSPEGTLPRRTLAELPDPTLQAVMARWLARRGAPSLPVRHWPRLRAELLDGRPDALPQLAWEHWSLRRHRDWIHLLTKADVMPLPAEGADWPDPSQPLVWAGRLWRADALVADLAADDPRLLSPWRLLPRQGGERWRPAGRSHSVSVKQWCQAQGIPPWARSRVVCVWVDGDVVAVAKV